MPECADGTGVSDGDPVSEGADPHPSRQQRADHPPAVCSLPACGGHGRFQPAAAWLGAVLHYGNCTYAVKKLRRYVAARVGRYLHRRRGQWSWGYTMYPDQFLHERYGLFAIPLTAPWKQGPCACQARNGVGKPYARKLHVRGDEGALETPVRCGSW